MFDHTLRSPVHHLLAVPSRYVARWLSPGQVTVVGGVIGLGAAVAASAGWWALALTAWIVNRVVDAMDGAVARVSSRSSDAGGYLDITVDMVVYAAVPLGVGFGRDDQVVWVAVAFVLGSFYVNTITWTYLSAVLEKRGRGAAAAGESTAVTMPAGLVEGAETIVFFGLFLAIPSLAAPIMMVMAALVMVGAGIRFAAGRKQIMAAEASVSQAG